MTTFLIVASIIVIVGIVLVSIRLARKRRSASSGYPGSHVATP